MATSATTDLRNRVRGRVVGRSDPEYHAARGVVDGNFDPRPAAIVRVADAADVATVISIAGAEGKPPGGPKRWAQWRGPRFGR